MAHNAEWILTNAWHGRVLEELESINRLLTRLLALQLPEYPTVEELFGGYDPDGA